MIRSVAVIGVGAMGAPVARRIQAAGYELTVCDSNTAALAAFADSSARIVATPADCAEADLAIIFVATGEQARDVILGDTGVMAAARRDQAPILAVMSTVSATTMEELARALRPSAVRLIDAPVTGGALRAEEGGLTILTGGDPSDIEQVAPVFALLGSRRFHCGGHGAAQKMKIINNILSIANVVIAGEAFRLAMDQGLDLAQVSQVMEAGTGRSFLSVDPAGPQRLYQTLAPDLVGYRTLVSILRKDIRTAAQTAADVDGHYPAILAIQALVESLDDETFAHWRRIADSSPAR